MPRAEHQKTICFNVTVDQLAVIRETADLNGMDVSSLVRNALFTKLREMRPDVDLRPSSRPTQPDAEQSAADEQTAPKRAPRSTSKKQAA